MSSPFDLPADRPSAASAAVPAGGAPGPDAPAAAVGAGGVPAEGVPVPAEGVPLPAVGGHAEDRDARPQFVLPLVVRLERVDPPGRTDALETSARAVLTLLADERAVDGGEWAERIAAWEDARIRKVVRRARGGEWRKAGELPGITVTGESAEVRVFPPIPLDGWPKELAKLQVSGTDLDDPADPGPAPEGVPVLWLNPELEMSAGKTMAQTGHAAQLAWWRLDDAQRKEWADNDFRLAVRTAPADAWPALTDGSLPVVRDAGFTEIAPGSCTVVADHPAFRTA